MACSSSGKSAPGGYLIFSNRNRSELLAIKSCSAKRIPSCRRAMEWSQTLRTSCFIWQSLPRQSLLFPQFHFLENPNHEIMNLLHHLCRVLVETTISGGVQIGGQVHQQYWNRGFRP